MDGDNMVDLKTEYELNHIYRMILGNPELPVTTTSWDSMIDLELFLKSLALASDLKRLPVLRSLSGLIKIDADMKQALQNSVVTVMSYTLRLYDEAAEDADIGDIIWEVTGIMSFDLTTDHIEIEIPNITWDYEGGYLLGDTVSLEILGEADGAVTTNAFPSSQIVAILFLEVDWREVTTKQLQEFVVEHLYARGD